MGYMGFGMQKWVYSLKPRKPFSKDRKAAHNTIERYNANKAFDKDTFSVKLNSLNSAKEKKTSNIFFNISLKVFAVIFLILIILLSIFIYNKGEILVEKQNQKNNLLIEKGKNSTDNAYQLMMEYGAYYLSKNSFPEAIFEYEQAIKKYPEKLDAKHGLVEVYYTECITTNSNCDLAIAWYNELVYEYDYVNHKLDELIECRSF